jgi:hypothetical protein
MAECAKLKHAVLQYLALAGPVVADLGESSFRDTVTAATVAELQDYLSSE